jgi:hypothetical protein
MAVDLTPNTPNPSPHTVDLTGLPELVIEQVTRIVKEAREKEAGGSVSGPNGGQPADRWAAAAEAVRGLVDYDFGAWAEQRAFDARHGKDHLE